MQTALVNYSGLFKTWLLCLPSGIELRPNDPRTRGHAWFQLVHGALQLNRS